MKAVGANSKTMRWNLGKIVKNKNYLEVSVASSAADSFVDALFFSFNASIYRIEGKKGKRISKVSTDITSF